MPFVEVEIWDEDGVALPMGQGEIVAKAEGQMAATGATRS
jgi:hypothetical protein